MQSTCKQHSHKPMSGGGVYQQWKLKILKSYLQFKYLGTFHLRTYSIPCPFAHPVTEISTITPGSSKSRSPRKMGEALPVPKSNLVPLACPTWLISHEPHTPQVIPRTHQAGPRGRRGLERLLPTYHSPVLSAGE